MHITPSPFLFLAATALPLLASAYKPDGVGCGIDGFGDAHVHDCKVALKQIDKSANLATGPNDWIRVHQSDPLTQWGVIAEHGQCVIGARTLIHLSGGLPYGNPPTATTFGGQKTVDFVHVSGGAGCRGRGLRERG